MESSIDCAAGTVVAVCSTTPAGVGFMWRVEWCRLLQALHDLVQEQRTVTCRSSSSCNILQLALSFRSVPLGLVSNNRCTDDSNELAQKKFAPAINRYHQGRCLQWRDLRCRSDVGRPWLACWLDSLQNFALSGASSFLHTLGCHRDRCCLPIAS